MSTEKMVIRDSIRQVKEIYKQISTLLESADGLMKEHEWAPNNNTVFYGSSAAIYLPQKWLPSALTREYRNKEIINAVLMMGVVLDYEDIEEPQLVGTFISINDMEAEFPGTAPNDSYYWYMEQKENKNEDGLVVIRDAKTIYSKEKRELSEIKAFAIPLLEIEDSEELKNQFVVRLMSLLPDSEA